MRFSALFAALTAALLFTACSSDDTASTDGTGEPITIRLNLAAAGGDESSDATRRMTRSWNYDTPDETYEDEAEQDKGNFDNGEGIYTWFVLMVNNETGEIEHVFTGSVDNKERDNVNNGNDIVTTTGPKTFYNFANLSQLEVATAAGLNSGADVFSSSNNLFVEGATFTSDQLTALNNATFALDGNGYDPLKRTDNLKGIPMSGKQDYDLTWTDHYNQTLTLWVVRMLAKLEFQFTNLTSEDLTLQSITIDPVTQNATTAGADNIMLFPTFTDPSIGATLKPNLATTATNVTTPIYNSTTGLTLAAATTTPSTVTKVIYVNEGQLPTDNTYKEYKLTLTLLHADGNTTDQRYTLISDNAANEWTYISRNDRRVLPIKLQEYKLTLTPYDYPPIGVLPSSVQEADGTFTCTFHAGGDFHLVPTVTNYATGATVAVTYSDGDWENVGLVDATDATVDWSTLYSTVPDWSTVINPAVGSMYIHGTFQYGLTANYTARHRLTVRVTQTDGTSTVVRTLAAPVIIKYEK